MGGKEKAQMSKNIWMESAHFDVEVFEGRVSINDDLSFPIQQLIEFMDLMIEVGDALLDEEEE